MHIVLDLPNGAQMWLGGIGASGQIGTLLDNGINAILAASAQPPVVRDSRIEMLGVFDGTGIAAGDIDKGIVVRVFDRVLKNLASGLKTLISCKNGAHRSSFEMALFLIFLTGCSADEVEAYLRKLRGIVDLSSMAPESRYSQHRRNVQPLEALRSFNKFFADEGLRSLSRLTLPAQRNLGFNEATGQRPGLNFLMKPAEFESLARSLGWLSLSEAG